LRLSNVAGGLQRECSNVELLDLESQYRVKNCAVSSQVVPSSGR